MVARLATRTWTQERAQTTAGGGGYTTRLVATAALEDLGQGPYFSLTAEEYDTRHRPRNEPVACGRMDEEIARAFPQARPFQMYTGWHLDRGEWYYIDNTMFWLGFTRDGHPSRALDGKPHKDVPNYEYAKSSCAYGAVEGDETVDLATLTGGEALAFLEERLPALMEAFRVAMLDLFNGDERARTIIAEHWNTAPHTFPRPAPLAFEIKRGDLYALDLLTAKVDECDAEFKARGFNHIDTPRDLSDAYTRAELFWAADRLRGAGRYLSRQKYD